MDKLKQEYTEISPDLAKEVITSFAEPVEKPIYVANREPDDLNDMRDMEREDYKAVWNDTDNRLATIVSDRYKIKDMKPFFGRVLNSLDKIEHRVSYINIKDFRESAYMEILFDEKLTYDDSDIRAGVRVGNSFDKSTTEFVEGYAVREICSNGLIGKKVMGRRSRKHLGTWSSDLIAGAIQEIIPQVKTRLQDIIDKALQEKVDFKYVEPTLIRLKLGKKLTEQITKELSDKPEITIWEIYNRLTRIIENEKEIMEKSRERYHRKANEILTSTQNSLKRATLEYIKENEKEQEYDKLFNGQKEIPEIIKGD